MDSDELYGPCAPAGAYGIGEHEKNRRPVSVVTLTDDTADRIKAFFSLSQDQELFTPIPLTSHVLWVMDCAGHVHLALEELIDSHGRLIGVLPKISEVRPAKGFIKLGHPTLLPDELTEARIAGEILYDPGNDKENEKRLWCLTNDSGRYGTRPWQKPNHLEAVCRYFESFGLYFTTSYIKPKT